ncbi:MAG: arsenic resistance protein [Variovorax sp.]|jgi:ACR3 family arsenite efflux pump ArsB|uniref:arsenic resistance protein n=1 Tax=Variovorax sp. PAMC 28711 TaxID=1795631 RepID=UPI0009E9C9B4|nr:arsenic resistance protein [Variovorax sp. PAMC 28711]RZL95573.1 MAG: arsenic resistance protein [Variovorax sp.]
MSLLSLRSALETRQVLIYFAAVVLAGILAWQWPASAVMALAIDPLLAFMLFVTFLQVPLTELRRAWSNMRFLGALLLANFVAVPLLVAVLLPWMPQDPLLRVGVLLVLLTPCIDYVVTFAHLGQADAKPLLASTPLLLAAQMVLLPVFLGFFMGNAAALLVQWEPFVHAFIWLIAVPLSLAAVFQAWAVRWTAGEHAVGWLGLFPVPAMAAVLFVVVAAVAPQLRLALDAVRAVAPVYVAFAIAAPMLGWGVARLCRLPADQGRAIAFSSATRNSLVVLPLGLAIPGALPWVPAVIVTQTLVELVSELVYVKVAPRLGTKAGRLACVTPRKHGGLESAAHRAGMRAPIG